MKLRTQILLFLFLFGLLPLLAAVGINLPFVLDRMELFYHKAHLQNLRADFRNLDQHLARRNEMTRVLAKLPEPGIMLLQGGMAGAGNYNLDQERARYANWMNRLLGNMGDITQILFVDQDSNPSFWLSREQPGELMQPASSAPQLPSGKLLAAALQERYDTVLVSPLVIARGPKGQLELDLHIVAPIALEPGAAPVGAAIMSIDIGGMASAYKDTLWVLDNGGYLDRSLLPSGNGNAFNDFPGLEGLFAHKQLTLWEGDGRQVIWLPMFPTQDDGALWVGRTVDPSPLASFSFSLSLRVLAIISSLVILTLFAAHWVAKRIAKVGQQVTDGIRRVVEHNEPVVFGWRKPNELRRFGESLTALGQQQQENVARLRANAQALEASNRYKSQFLANVSHELRTPLNSILLLSKMLSASEARLPAEAARQAGVIHEASKNLKTLIDNILDMSRIEAGRAALSLQRIHLPGLLAEIHALLAPQFSDKGLGLELIIEPGAPEYLDSDPDKIAQILRNFLSNSVKFTEQGGAVLRLHGTQPEQRHPIRISVEDTGIGIDPSQQVKIFAAFQQADGSTNRRYGGSGLGLTISRQLALLLGGDIQVNSNLGQGSRFTLGLPMTFDEGQSQGRPVGHEPLELAASEPEGQGCPEADFSGHGVLIIDDDIESLLRLTPLLEGWHMRVCAAADREEAGEALHDPTTGCDLVLINWAMSPSKLRDTIQFIEGIAEAERPPVIAIARHSGQRIAGAQQMIEPPLQPLALRQAIAQLIYPP